VTPGEGLARVDDPAFGDLAATSQLLGEAWGVTGDPMPVTAVSRRRRWPVPTQQVNPEAGARGCGS
jgi:hypothetical protein